MSKLFNFIYTSVLYTSLRYVKSYDHNIPSYERQALYELYNSTNGIDWDYQEGDSGHWNFSNPNVNPCLASDPWQGLNCTIPISSSTYSYISEIVLSNYKLNGTIPDSITTLTHLQYLDLSHNLLFNHPPLPDSIGNLSGLAYLDLSYNFLLGYIPHSFYNLSTLQYVDLSYNRIQGKVNNFINLPNLTYLSLDSCELSGTIPSSFSTLSRLNYLNFGGNELIGMIPSELGELLLLECLYLDDNYLSGTIPSSFINMNYLTTFSLANNDLHGTIPHWLGDLSNLTSISLESNHFMGTIPITLSYLQHLGLLSLDHNILTGMIPDWISNLSELKYLSLGNNQLTSTIPSCIADLHLLVEIYLHTNYFTGSIPSNIFNNISVLSFVEFQENDLTGSIPTSLSLSLLLVRLCVQDNHLSGNLDYVFNGQYQKYLGIIQLSNNHLTGKYPEEIFKSQKLHIFTAVGNCFHGSIPSIICNSSQLSILALDGSNCASSCRNIIFPGISSAYITQNKITGGIPKCLWSMPNLTVLHLSGNGLTGSLPDNIKLSNTLKDLSLSYNLLTGSIPTYIQERKWINLDLSHNFFSGTLRSNFENQPSNTSITLNSNRISGNIPNNLQNIRNLSILEGNSFACKYDRSDLPKHDDNKDTYQCGSNTFNISYYIWLGLLFLVTSLTILAWYNRVRINKYIQVSYTVEKVWKWANISQCINSHYEIETNPIINKLEYFKRYDHILDLLSRYSLYCTVMVIAILLPVYVTTNAYYSTQSYDYAWTVTVLYTSGKIAFGLIFSVLIIFTLMQSSLFHFLLLRQYKNNEKNLEEGREYDGSQDYHYKKMFGYINTKKLKIYSFYVYYVMINFIIVGGVNIAYVYAALYQSNRIIVLAQILLSIFKMVWNNIASPKMVAMIIRYLATLNAASREIRDRLFIMQFVVSLLNNIFIPCIIVAIVSPNCFYHVFEQESDVTSSFVSACCTSINLIDECVKLDITITKTSYSPPFIYSYQCSADFITYYASVFVFICIISTFIIPAVQIIVLKLSNKYNWISKYIKISKLFDVNNFGGEILSLVPLESIYEILVSLLTLIGLLLTFGVIFPPLAIAFLITICRRIYFHKIIIGRYISHALEQKAYTCLDTINEDCKVIPLLTTLQLCGWILLYISFMFYTLFVFDILGDETGVDKAYWVLIVMPCLPMCLFVVYKYYKYFRSYDDIKAKYDNNKVVTMDIEITTRSSISEIPSDINSHTMISNPLSMIVTDSEDLKDLRYEENIISISNE